MQENMSEVKKAKTVLVIDYTTNWFAIFGRRRVLSDGTPVVIEQASWKDISIVSVSDSCQAIVHLARAETPLPFSNQSEDRVVVVDFLLIRNFPTSLHGENYERLLLGFDFAMVPSVNSVASILADMHRPRQHAELRRIEARIVERHKTEGSSSEPMIHVVPMQYHANQGPTIKINLSDVISSGIINKEDVQTHYPAVVKAASTHAGYGKIVAHDEAELDDLRSVLALGTSYYTVEPMIDVAYEVRLQRIGDRTRCFRRTSSTSWKNNWGDISFRDEEVLPRHKEWCDECQKMWGGLDIFALDVLVAKDGSEVLLEINSTACGLMYEHEEEDNKAIADLVIRRMNEHFCK